MVEEGTTIIVAPVAEEAAAKVGGGGGGGGGGLHDHDDATIGTINIIKLDDGVDGSKRGQQQRLGQCPVVHMYNVCDCPL